MNNNDEKFDWSQYGLTITAKVPADFKHKMKKDADQLGISLADHAATVLMSTDQKDEEYRQNLTTWVAEIQLVEQEKYSMLEKAHKALAKATMPVTTYEREVFSRIKHNRDILLQYLNSVEPVSRVMLTRSGFDFGICTEVKSLGASIYITLVDVAYSVIGEMVNIIDMNENGFANPLMAKS